MVRHHANFQLEPHITNSLLVSKTQEKRTYTLRIMQSSHTHLRFSEFVHTIYGENEHTKIYNISINFLLRFCVKNAGLVLFHWNVSCYSHSTFWQPPSSLAWGWGHVCIKNGLLHEIYVAMFTVSFLQYRWLQICWSNSSKFVVASGAPIQT